MKTTRRSVKHAIGALDAATRSGVFGMLSDAEAAAAKRLRRRGCAECECAAETFEDLAHFWKPADG